MFAQLCTDLPWTQTPLRGVADARPRRTRRVAGPAQWRAGIGRSAVDWYRSHDRLHCGDPITMAADALAAYEADTAAGKDALLVCDTTEMADALNERIHHERSTPDAPTVSGRTRTPDRCRRPHPDPAQRPHYRPTRPRGIAGQLDSVRNGNRWRVAAIDAAGNRIAAERLEDGARAVFNSEYLREHVSLGYAVTVHTAQGATADTTHAVLGENTNRALLYVAMSRGRYTNTAYLYEQTSGEGEYSRQERGGTQLTSRGTNRDAADAVRAVLANHRDPTPVTALDYAAHTPGAALPDRVRSLLNNRTTAVHRRRAVYETWRTEAQTQAHSMSRARDRAATRDRSPDRGIEL